MIRGRTPASPLGITLDAADARALARFYRDLLGWELVEDSPPWCTLRPPGASITLAPSVARRLSVAMSASAGRGSARCS